ncbi:immunity 53 family protein [Uliginosibacterium sediminicola]|uniref:Immunity 53 family protein n=1 Tax=Uliginosibacterium sediminicola TaxID=2024550 RepID=A0ABU9Z3I3_9RHOO
MNELSRLQSWYANQCNGIWEHSYGLSIETLDNPGWCLTVDLIDTDIFELSFIELKREAIESDDDWLVCRVEDGRFRGHCGPANLQELLSIFLDFAGA